MLMCVTRRRKVREIHAVLVVCQLPVLVSFSEKRPSVPLKSCSVTKNEYHAWVATSTADTSRAWMLVMVRCLHRRRYASLLASPSSLSKSQDPSAVECQLFQDISPNHGALATKPQYLGEVWGVHSMLPVGFSFVSTHRCKRSNSTLTLVHKLTCNE